MGVSVSDAQLLVMSAARMSDASIGGLLGRSAGWVARRREALQAATPPARLAAATWTSWDGRSARPLSADWPVQVLLRDGSTANGVAGDWCWVYPQGPDDQEPDEIVAYRALTRGLGQ